jgi:DNA polymerase-3 subunit delta
MKLQGQRVERFLKTPDPATPAVLVYGPDEGLVRERAERLIRSVLPDLDDPFRFAELMGDQLRTDPARLADEGRSLSLVGGRRVVRVRQATDQASAACRTLLQQGAVDALVVIEAGDLPPSSSLRKLFEGAANGAALPCYRDQARDLASLIEATLDEHGLEPDADARAWLIDHLGADRGLTRSELDKLILYMGTAGDAPGRRRVTLADAAAVIGDGAALGLDDLVDAAATGDLIQLQRCLDRLLGEGQHPVRLVRALANHVVRLRRLALQVADGQSVERAVEQSRPPIHFRRRDAVKAALRRFGADQADRALPLLIEAELMCKTSGYPADLVCRDAVVRIARLAAGSARTGQAGLARGDVVHQASSAGGWAPS